MLGIQCGFPRYRPIFVSGVGDRDRQGRHDDRHLSDATGTRRQDRQTLDCLLVSSLLCAILHFRSPLRFGGGKLSGFKITTSCRQQPELYAHL